MRTTLLPALLLVAACSGSLYAKYAGPATATPDEVYSCVQTQLRTMGYGRTQFNDNTRWWVARKEATDQVSSGLYRKTLDVLDTQVKADAAGHATLEITARTYQQFANARGVDDIEQKASDRVKLDAQALGQACIK